MTSAYDLIEMPFPSGEGPAVRIIKAIAHLLDYEKGPWVGGGIVRRILTGEIREAHDVDVFFKSPEQLGLFSPKLREIEKNTINKGEWWVAQAQMQRTATETHADRDTSGLCYIRSSSHVPLQLVDKMFFPTMEAMLEDFDFTICQMVTDGKTIRYTQEAKRDLDTSQLRIHANSSGVRHVSRMLRYISYGFEPEPQVLKAIAEYPQYSYYDRETGGIGCYGAEIAKLKALDMEDQITLSVLGDVIAERPVGDCRMGVVYMHGYPYPSPLAFLYLLGASPTRDWVLDLLKPLWEAKGLNVSIGHAIPEVSPTALIGAYSRAYAE